MKTRVYDEQILEISHYIDAESITLKYTLVTEKL